MADMNKVVLQGLVPQQDWAIHAINMDDEKRACVHVKVSVRNGRKDDGSQYENEDIFDVVALGKTAINFMKFNPLGRSFIFEGRLTPSHPRMNNGQPVLDANGKKEFFPMGFQFYSFYTQRSSRNNQDNNGDGMRANVSQNANTTVQQNAFNPMDTGAFDFGGPTAKSNSSEADAFKFAL